MPAATPEESRSIQEAIASLAAAPLRAAWSLWNRDAVGSSLPVFRRAVGATVDYYGQAAAAQSLQHYRAVRADSGVRGRFDVPAPTVPEGFVDQAVVEALAEAEADIQRAVEFLDSQAEQLILEQGRRQAMSAVNADKYAKGWARVTNPGACSFCRMLAIRAGSGYLYTSARAANFRAHTKKPNGSGGDCRCTVEPVFGHYEPPARTREDQRVWDEATADRRGHDARVAFRQAIEGREVTGSDRKSQSRKSTTRDKFEGGQKTPENQRYQLELLEKLPPAKTPEAAKWRAERMAEIRKFLGE